MTAQKPESSGAEPRPSTILLVDHPNLITMEKFNGRSITPMRIMSLAKSRGNVVYARVFTDSARLNDVRQVRDWETAGFRIEYCRRYGRPITERTSVRQSVMKEMVDVELIEYAHQIVPLIKPAQVILVAGDSNYVPLVRSLVQRTGVDVRVFATNQCGLIETLLSEKVLREAYILYDVETREEVAMIPLIQRIAMEKRDEYTLTERDKAELDALSEMRMVCPTCTSQVELGLWKAHPCHPNPILPAATHASPPPVTQPKSSTPPNGLPSQYDETIPVPISRTPPVIEPLTPLDPARWVQIRNQARTIPRGDTQQIIAALKGASSETSLAWLVDDERLSRTQDEIVALKRVIEKKYGFPIVSWQHAVMRIRDELAEPRDRKALETQLNAWAWEAAFPDALALLVDEGVLQVTENGLIARGSLVRPAFRFACNKIILEALHAAKPA
ncbi:MAG TPA: NYN domain-containing protein [Candidatus Methylomirabilis sp.]|nr:NYN domain-containing protein [Candidatus Methylomirabilis sp.]